MAEATPEIETKIAPPAPRQRRRNVVIAVAVVLVIFVVVAALSLIPVPRSYTFGDATAVDSDINTSFSGSESQSLCPTGAAATMNLTITGSLSASFKIVNPAGAVIWGPESSSGHTSFTLQCGVYTFSWAGTGNGTLGFAGTVTYRAPLIYPTDD
jgi:hypothetical protein